MGKLQYFTNLNLAAIKGDDFPYYIYIYPYVLGVEKLGFLLNLWPSLNRELYGDVSMVMVILNGIW